MCVMTATSVVLSLAVAICERLRWRGAGPRSRHAQRNDVFAASCARTPRRRLRSASRRTWLRSGGRHAAGRGIWRAAGRRVDGAPAVYWTTLVPPAGWRPAGIAWMDTHLLAARLYSCPRAPGAGPTVTRRPFTSRPRAIWSRPSMVASRCARPKAVIHGRPRDRPAASRGRLAGHLRRWFGRHRSLGQRCGHDSAGRCGPSEPRAARRRRPTYAAREEGPTGTRGVRRAVQVRAPTASPASSTSGAPPLGSLRKERSYTRRDPASTPDSSRPCSCAPMSFAGWSSISIPRGRSSRRTTHRVHTALPPRPTATCSQRPCGARIPSLTPGGRATSSRCPRVMPRISRRAS